MIWTAVVAAITAIGKLIFVTAAAEVGSGMPPMGILFRFASIVAIISLFVALVALPMVWVVLRHRPSPRGRYAIVGTFLVGPMLLHEVLYFVIGQQPSVKDRFIGICAWYGFLLATLVVTAAGLWLARICGFRFMPVRSQSMAEAVAGRW